MKGRRKLTIKSHPLGHFIKPFVEKIDDDPRIQLKIHTFGFWYWTANFPLITYLFFFEPALWLRYGLFITLIYSIYANWSTDYSGMSSSQAVINTESVNISHSDVTIEQVDTTPSKLNNGKRKKQK